MVKLQGGASNVCTVLAPYTTRLYRSRAMPLQSITYSPASAARQRARVCRARNRAFIDELNARTVCAHCGARPIEWHNPEHVEKNRQDYRIIRMVNGPRSLEAIKAELTRCTPLCRRCHMQEDGRLAAFTKRVSRPARPKAHCLACGELKQLVGRGLCRNCYSRDHARRNYASTRETTSRHRGVSWKAKERRWVAGVKVQGVSHHLGYFHDEEEAAAAARAGRERLLPNGGERRVFVLAGEQPDLFGRRTER